MVIFIIIFAILTLILALWGISNLIAIMGGSPPVHTPDETCMEILKASGISSKDTLIDLGSGSGNMIVCASKMYRAKAIGYEISPYPYLASKFKTIFIRSKTRINFASVFEAKLSEASYIYIYLLPKMLMSIFPKIKHEAKPGTIVITRGFPLPSWQPIKRVQVGNPKTKIFIYKVK